MNRKLALCVLTALLAVPVVSSAGWEIGVESVAPMGDFEDIAGGGGGLYVQHTRPMNENVLLSGYVGAISYGGVKVLGLEFQWYGYPVTVGGTYYLKGVDEGGFFIKANTGLLYKMGTVEFLGEEDEETDTGFVFSPGLGWDFGNINLTADYNLGNDDWTWFAVKVAYQFGS